MIIAASGLSVRSGGTFERSNSLWLAAHVYEPVRNQQKNYYYMHNYFDDFILNILSAHFRKSELLGSCSEINECPRHFGDDA